MTTVQEIVQRSPRYFSGDKKVTEELVTRVEDELGLTLPDELKWLLVTHGYGECRVVSNIKESISDTMRFRNSADLPVQYIVLEDLNDAGVVLLDTQSEAGAVIWLATHCLGELKENGPEKVSDSDYFPNLASWVEFQLEIAIEESAT